MELHQFMIDKQAELSQQYRKVEWKSFVSVTLKRNSIGEKFTARNTPLNQLGYGIELSELPESDDTEITLGIKENGTHVVFSVVAKGKRKPERKEFYFLWSIDA